MDKVTLYKHTLEYYENNKKILLEKGYKIVYDTKEKTEFAIINLNAK